MWLTVDGACELLLLLLEVAVVLPVVVVPVLLLVVVMVVFFTLDMLVTLLECEVLVLVMTMVAFPELVVVVAVARPELYSAQSFEPTEAAMMRSEAVQAAIRQGAA